MYVGGFSVITGTASQSSTGHGGIASRAVDGNTNQQYQSNSCTHTEGFNQPWWRLDFGMTKRVSKVEVWNRADCCSDRLSGVEVRVNSALCGILGSSTSVQTVSCANALGSFVQLQQKRAYGYLSLCGSKSSLGRSRRCPG